MKKIISLIIRQPIYKDLSSFISHIFNSLWYLHDIYKYINKKNQIQDFKISVLDLYPCIDDKTSFSPFDSHYIYHPTWAANIIAKIKPKVHHDFSSILSFSTVISAFIPTVFHDFRKAEINIDNFNSLADDLTNLKIKSNSLESVSCMHVIEHIGLGRYGDPIDPEGDIKAIEELKRIVSSKGNLLIAVPMAEKPKLMFNAHRIYSYEQIMSNFQNFDLKNFAFINDMGIYISTANKTDVTNQRYGCGCFWFIKK